ncbi:hypothetical protein IE53DRAFT_88493 [Violaceomyces palustris]|uniref:Uncharacterized protein n=1 Tax=Violaceomyces palustris TaxID=1673888 RepID=A0ACD0NXN7_9BASI|nr:hypothetical protein IE53DRAFT_88493 [Violaceomyces palustris]
MYPCSHPRSMRLWSLTLSLSFSLSLFLPLSLSPSLSFSLSLSLSLPLSLSPSLSLSLSPCICALSLPFLWVAELFHLSVSQTRESVYVVVSHVFLHCIDPILVLLYNMLWSRRLMMMYAPRS